MERRDVNIKAPTAVAFFSANARRMIIDPDRPTVSAEDLYKENGGYIDPHLTNHNCPFCKRTMNWDMFVAHFKTQPDGTRGCLARWFHKVDPTLRRYAGASPGG